MKRKKETDKRERHAAATLTESLKIFMKKGERGRKDQQKRQKRKKQNMKRKKTRKKENEKRKN